MRSELELIEKIERYINHELSTEDTAAFEQEMRNDAALREAVALQRDVMQGIGRAVIRQRVQHAGHQYHSGKKLLRLGIGAAVAVVILTTAILFLNKKHQPDLLKAAASNAYSDTTLPALNEAGQSQWAAADSLIPAQLFNLTAGRDTVIETRGGIVMSIPANAFVDAAGKIANGVLSLCIKEALGPATILSAGLSTWSGNQLLETGGMFFLDARQGTSILKINPANGIYAVVPGNVAKPGMQLFSGKRQPDGSIDWQDPKPVSHELLAVDILSLDFYPPDYFELLHKNGYATGSKHFTDSVYYSLSGLFAIRRDTTLNVRMSELGDSLNGYRVTDTSIRVVPPLSCGINPSKIKTIWSTQYQNTLLATREFEQRIKLIHRSKNPALLDLYVRNLGKNLYEIDEMAARITTGDIQKSFLQFAAMRDGKVKNGSVQFDKLRDYYTLKTKILTEAIAKAETKIRSEEMQADNMAAQKRAGRQTDNYARIAKNFSEELRINLESAYAQTGKKMAFTNAPIATTVLVNNAGWSNLDRYVLESTTSRTTLDYTDPATGKKAVITYQPITVSIADAKSYDRLLVYLLPDQLSSYMNLRDSGGIFSESLNGLMMYDMVCIGFKGEQRFFLKMDNVAAQHYTALTLKALPAKDMSALLNSLRAGQGSAVISAVDYAVWDLQRIHVEQQRRKWQDMIGDLKRSFFPCVMDDNENEINSDALPAEQGYGDVQPAN